MVSDKKCTVNSDVPGVPEASKIKQNVCKPAFYYLFKGFSETYYHCFGNMPNLITRFSCLKLIILTQSYK